MMKIAVLFSGGKDSTYATYLAQKKGHEIAFLATIFSKNIDSYMYHTSNIGLTVMQSESIGIKLASKLSKGEKEDEVKDLEIALKDLGVEGVVCGAIASKYQRDRVQKVCKKLGLKLLAPLWKKNPKKLVTDMINSGFEIIITAVSADGLDKKWLGRTLDMKALNELEKLSKKYRFNIAGEGGEFETFVLDCPLFKKKLKVLKANTIWEKNSGKYTIEQVKMVDK